MSLDRHIALWFICFLATEAWASQPAETADQSHSSTPHIEEHKSQKKMREVFPKSSARDVTLPMPLINKLESEYRHFLDQQIRRTTGGIKRVLLNLEVELTRRGGAALSEDVRVLSPPGGGVIDLADYVSTERGGFNVKITPTKSGRERLADTRVFFLSQARSRKFGLEKLGAGCGKFFEVTKYFNRKMSGDGFEVYTADQRYVSVLSGTFVIFKFEFEGLHVGSLTFSDSRYPELGCE